MDGAQKQWQVIFEPVFPDFCHEAQVACKRGSSMEVTQTSLRWHWHQKATVAVAKTMALKVLFRSSVSLRANRWARVTGGCLGWVDEVGAAEEEP